MKFLCSNCKAKYQIADEKLEGRAVRMKCRKCGNIIEVPTPSSAGSGAERLPPAPSTPKPPSRPTPSPSALAPSPPRPAARPKPPAAAVRPAPPRGPAAPLSQIASKLVSPPPRPPQGGGLAEAFSQNVKDPEKTDVSAAIEVLSAGAGEEWYVGINGVPLGPVRLSALRQKASQGVIDEDSLVWREGFEEWLPLRTFPELVVLVKEARDAAGRQSFVPSVPGVRRSAVPAVSPRPAATHSYPGAAGPIPASFEAPTFDPGAVDTEDEPATIIASSPAEMAAAAQMARDPYAPSAPYGAAPLGTVTADPFALPPGESADSSPDDLPRKSIVDDFAVGVRRQVRMHPAAYVLIAIAFGFGATGAVVFFTGDRGPAAPATIQVVTVNAPPTIPAAAGTQPPTVEGVAVNIEGDPGSDRVPGNGPRVASAGTDATGKGTDDKGSGSLPPRVGLGDGPSVAGPTVGGPGGVDPNLPQQLDQADIERVVASQRVSVKRGCWEPALASRDPKAPKSAKVTVSITIGPGGNVTSASASGGSGFPDLASCVAGRVRRWTFPRSGGESRANIPFAFFSQ